MEYFKRIKKMTDKLWEYKLVYRRRKFLEQGKKYATAPTDEEAVSTLEYLLGKIDGGAKGLLIERFCPYSQRWQLVKTYED